MTTESSESHLLTKSLPAINSILISCNSAALKKWYLQHPKRPEPIERVDRDAPKSVVTQDAEGKREQSYNIDYFTTRTTTKQHGKPHA